jgi:hypothetical protein
VCMVISMRVPIPRMPPHQMHFKPFGFTFAK